MPSAAATSPRRVCFSAWLWVVNHSYAAQRVSCPQTRLINCTAINLYRGFTWGLGECETKGAELLSIYPLFNLCNQFLFPFCVNYRYLCRTRDCFAFWRQTRSSIALPKVRRAHTNIVRQSSGLVFFLLLVGGAASRVRESLVARGS